MPPSENTRVPGQVPADGRGWGEGQCSQDLFLPGALAQRGEEGEGDGKQTPQNHVRVTEAGSPMEETERDVGTKC